VLPATATPAPGDLVFYGTGPGPGESDHVGVVRHVFPDGQISTIEGNYDGRVSPVGPFSPSSPIGEQAQIYGYAQPPAAAPRRSPAGGDHDHSRTTTAPIADRRTRQ
jgi:hypothetical protein